MVGIVFMVLLMTCVFVGKDTAVAFLDDLITQKKGKAHATVYEMTETQQEELFSKEYVKEYAISETIGVTDFTASENKERPFLNVKAYDEKAYDWFNIFVTEGRLPKNSEEIVLSETLRQDGAEIKIGDVIEAELFERTLTAKLPGTTTIPALQLVLTEGETVEIAAESTYWGGTPDFSEGKKMLGKTKHYTVVGFMKRPNYEDLNSASYPAITLYDAAAAGELRNLSVRFDTSSKIEIMDDLEERFPDNTIWFNEYLLLLHGAGGRENPIQGLLLFMEAFFIVLIVLASVVMISNVFQLSYRERCKYLGMLSSVGATAKQKRSSVYYEAFTLLLPSLIVGIFLGLAMVKIGMELLKPSILTLMRNAGFWCEADVKLCVDPLAILLVVLFCVITVFIAVLRPAAKIGKNGAVENIRGNAEYKNKPHKMRKGLGFGAAGMLAEDYLFVQPKKRKSVSRSLMVFLVILLITSAGATLIHNMLGEKFREHYTLDLNMENKDVAFFQGNVISGYNLEKKEYETLAREYEAVKQEVFQSRDVKKAELIAFELFSGEVSKDIFSEEYKNVIREYLAAAYADRTDVDPEEFFGRYHFAVNILMLPQEKIEQLAKKCGTDLSVWDEKKVPYAFLTAESTFEEEQQESRIRKEVFSAEVKNSTDLPVGAEFTVSFPTRSVYVENIGVSGAEETQGGEYGTENEESTVDSEEWYDDYASHMVEVEAPYEICLKNAGVISREDVKEYVTLGGEMLWLVIGEETADQIAEAAGQYVRGQLFEEVLRITVDDLNCELLRYLRDLSDEELTENRNCYYHYTDRTMMAKSLKGAFLDMIDILLGCFVALTSVICLMNLGNSVGGRIADRKKDFASLMSIGMTKGQIRKWLVLECFGNVFEGGIQAVLSTGVCLVLLHLGLREAVGRSFASVIPVTLGLISFAAVTGVLLLMTLVSFSGHWKAQNLLENMREESV